MPTGVYSLVDADNIVCSNAGTSVNGVGLNDPANPSARLEVKHRMELSQVFESDQLGKHKFMHLVGINMTWDGHLVVGSTNAIAVLDRSMKNKALRYSLPAGQFLTNSFAAEGNTIYVATGSKMARKPGLMIKLVWTVQSISALKLTVPGVLSKTGATGHRRSRPAQAPEPPRP